MNAVKKQTYPDIYTPENFPDTIPSGLFYRIPDPDQVAANERLGLENYHHHPKKVASLYSGERQIQQLNLHLGKDGKLSSLYKQSQVRNGVETVLRSTDRPLRAIFSENTDTTYQEVPVPKGHISATTIKNGVIIAERNQDALLAAQLSKHIRQHAANDAHFDENNSKDLSQHIVNLNANNPIRLSTAEYGIFDILKLTPKKFEGSSGKYHIATVRIKGGIKNLLIREEMFVVGDLSRKILGEVDDRGRFRPTNQPCTITSIKSKNIPAKSQIDTTKPTILGKIGDTFASIKKWFAR